MNSKIVLFVFLLSMIVAISMAGSSTAGSSRWATTTGEETKPPTTGQPVPSTTGTPEDKPCGECQHIIPKECVYDARDPDAAIKLDICLKAKINLGPLHLNADAQAHARVTGH